jgi:hypothetical protein
VRPKRGALRGHTCISLSAKLALVSPPESRIARPSVARAQRAAKLKKTSHSR